MLHMQSLSKNLEALSELCNRHHLESVFCTYCKKKLQINLFIPIESRYEIFYH